VTNYPLYVESGPRRMHTMVHVFSLLGCTAQGPTTQQALKATPHAIRQFLCFLQDHGAMVDAEAPFTTVVKEHVIKGPSSGKDRQPDGFSPDFESLRLDELRLFVGRLHWLRDELAALLERCKPEQWTEKPARSRSLVRIAEHIAEASSTYLCDSVGTVDGLTEALHAVHGRHGDVTALRHLWAIDEARWNTLSAVERAQAFRHGQQTWTVRRGLRRALEHEWEHLQELRQRTG
jgi:predicted RNase H-like HicB family nuclease